MAKVLGLDLGTNSIGWAVVDDQGGEVLGMGSRIFPEGVVNLGEGEGREVSKNASRTDSRGTRRQFFRRCLRKRYLLRELAKNNMCPIDYTFIKVWNQKQIFGNATLQEWLKLNPYELRAKALNQKLSKEELGRIFYHMIQRRGFQSNSRSAGAENNEKSVIFKGDAKAGKIGIAETADSIQENQTLGSYLNQIYPKQNRPFTGVMERIRNRYTTRQMYIDEFESIWEQQKQYHQELTDELKTVLGGRKKDGFPEDGVLFHQRPHTTKRNGETYKNVGVAARGQLHKETVFGKRKAPHNETAFHVRKPIDTLITEKQLEKVVDRIIKHLIFKRIQVLGGFVKGKIPVETFFMVNENGIQQPQIFLPNKNGSPVPVLKVRMRENIGGAEQLKDDLNQWVNPRNNHHVLIYKDEEGNLNEDVVTFWTVAERKRKGFPIYQLPTGGKEIITTLHINDMFLLGLNEDEINWENVEYNLIKENLYRVQKLTSGDYFFRGHISSTVTDANYKQIRGFGVGKTGWFNFNPIKVKISVSGKIQKL